VAEFRNELARLAERGTRVGPEALIERIELEMADDPIVGAEIRPKAKPGERVQSTRSLRRGLGIGLAVMLAVLVVGGAWLVISRDAPIAEPTMTSTLAVAESFMEAWAAGDGEAVAAMVSAEATLGGLELLPPSHDWYRAVGQEFQTKGCEVLPITFRTFQGVSCEYTFENKLTRALGMEPVAVDERVAGSFVDARGHPHRFEFVLSPFGGFTAVVFVRRIGRDRRDAQQREKLILISFLILINVGDDFVHGR